jgi:hypothetical protein
MVNDARITDYEAFWLFYLREHADPRTRALHYAGTFTAVLGIVACVVLGRPWFLIAVPIAGYGPAWIAHFFIEKNRPATFRYPLWSFVSDFRMAFAWVTGQIDTELERAGVAPAVRPIRRQR